MPNISRFKFSPASINEHIVIGAARPGYTQKQVKEWVEYIQNLKIQGVCCLLSKTQLACYTDLLGTFRQTFGATQVCWAPIEDFRLATPEILFHQILPFLDMADRQNQKVVVHCSGGIGLTGFILAAWLVAGRGFHRKTALSTIIAGGRNPYEAVFAAPLEGRNPWRVFCEVNELLDECTHYRNKVKQCID